jgi:competence protein ComEA
MPTKKKTRRPARRAKAKPKRSRPRASKRKPAPPKIVNINTARIPELMTLPHVGPEIARRIVAYREKYGRFDEHYEIMEVDGIGEREYADMKRFFVIG